MDGTLKSENDKLKLALAQSNANLRKWEEETQNLKSTNTRLAGALQESHSNVDEWKKQLQYYKDECQRLRNGSKLSNGLNSSTNGINKMDNDVDEVSSSSMSYNQNKSFNSNQNNIMMNGSSNNLKLKQELIRLSDNFDKKLNELNEIREQIRKIVNEIS